MHVVDITDIPFKENTFDYIISNHILEHIKDEEKDIAALMEYARERKVLKRVQSLIGVWL